MQALHRYLTWTPSRLLVRRADRPGRRPADAEPAGHHRRVPELAGAADRPGRCADTLEDVFTSRRARRWRRTVSSGL